MPPVGLQIARSDNRAPSRNRLSSSSTSSPTHSHAGSPTDTSLARRSQSRESSSHSRHPPTPDIKALDSLSPHTHTHHMSSSRTSPNRPGPSRRPSKFGGRRKEERKASVRKHSFDIDDAIFGSTNNDGDDESDLSDLTDEDDAAQTGPGSSKSRRPGSVADSDAEDSDSDMAAKLLAAGDGESLLGSGESDIEQEVGEERYIIAHAHKSDNKAKARAERVRAIQQQRLQKRQEKQRRSAQEGAEGDIEDEASPEDDLGAFSPETARLLGLPVVEDELYHEQPGFHSDSEPSFSDFFASDHPDEGFDDDDELTSFDENEEDSDVSDISDLESALVGEPFLAHVGALAEADAMQGAAIAADGGAGSANAMATTAQDAEAMLTRQDIPLLVIEDLDGRLIYARAGDGEAVFGSDGEFEFVDSEDEEDTDDEMDALDARDPRWSARQWSESGVGMGFDEQGYGDDDGDTTDELPDEEMPFPRLLVGSVGPRGGRTSRRARAMAAHMRKLSPRGDGKRGHSRTASNVTDATMSVTSPTTPMAELDAPLPASADAGSFSQGSLALPPASPSAESTASSTHASNALSLDLVQGQQQQQAVPTTRNTESKSSAAPTFAQVAASQPEPTKPAMGSFMPSSSKSIHRAVVDGSGKAASPFTSKHSLQRRGLAGRRRPRQSSFSSSSTLKRPRRGSGSNLFPAGEDLASEPASSPETLKTAAPLPMELDDVVDASMLWRSGDSSDGETADNNDSDMSDSTAGPSGRSRSKGSDANGPSDGFGLNSNAFSRWRKIPMGAFREQQQGMLSGGGSNRSSGSRATGGQQAFAGNYLLQRVQRRQDQSPFRRTGNHGSSLHMVVPAAHPHSHSTPGQTEIIVSPVLWPVHRKSRTTDDLYDDIHNMRAPVSGRTGGVTDADHAGSPRKMTKREKRERKAQRAIVRRAARAERQRIRNELSQPQPLDEVFSGNGANGPDEAFNTAPSTPRLGTASAIPDYLSPSKGMGMPRLQITEASPRASPVPNQNTSQAGEHMQGSHPTSSFPSSSTTTLPSHTPPTHAVADNSSIPSLPSATFGASLASPLFGGLFAPLNMSSSDEQELDLEKEGGSMLQI